MVPTLQKFLLSQQIASHQLNSTLPGGTAGYPAHHLPELIYGFEKINIEFYFWTKHCTRKNSSVIPILYPPVPVSVNYRHWPVGILVFWYQYYCGYF